LGRVLLVEDEPYLRKVLSTTLRQDGHVLVEAETVKQGLQAVYGNDFEVVLLDRELKDGEGFEVLKAVQELGRSTAVVMVTAHSTAERAVEAMRSGAFDLLTKPFSSDDVRAIVSRAAKWSLLDRHNHLRTESVDQFERHSEIRGSSESIARVRDLVSRVGPTDATVLITGETGTGKELVVRAIHRSSARATKPLISVNCAAFSETLLESELFGHERGAFTGAERTRQGLFEAAHGGTLFLDEVGEISPAAQAKLLRVLAEGKIIRVGSTAAREVDVRVLAATHRDLRKEVREGRFRQDLYYRLAIVPITVPPLRKRATDIPEIAEYLLREITSDLKTTRRTLHVDALQQLMSYSFPGNVRELRNLLERACILTSGPEILPADLPELTEDQSDAESGRLAMNEQSLPETFHLRSTLASWERRIIEQTLSRTKGSKTEAARRLGISKSDLSYKLSKYGILAESLIPQLPQTHK
jgi:DNA-binding NtrC family response regulator